VFSREAAGRFSDEGGDVRITDAGSDLFERDVFRFDRQAGGFHAAGSLHEMERTGGEPDVIGHDKKTGEYIFYDCSGESPKGRRSICYDRHAPEARKEHKPKNSAMGMAADMGIELLTEEQYRELQRLENFDTKTSSWIKTPSDIRKLGGAIFADY
jgi:hypothetical protein